MEPTVLGGRLASAVVTPLLKKLFTPEAPGAGLVDRPVRLKDLVSFRGEKRSLGEKDVGKLAAYLVSEALASPGEPPFPATEGQAVAHALGVRLLAFGDLDMDDVQAVRLGHRELAARLCSAAPRAEGLSTDADYFLDSATEWSCLQILEFFTRRSTFLARTLVEQSRAQARLIARVDELLTRHPRPHACDTAFERRYLPYLIQRHDHITIYGIDLRDSPDRWPLEAAYLSLEAATPGHPAPDTPTAVLDRLPADEALNSHDRILLRGDAGSGKTTLVQWLAVATARDGDRVPYVLPLRTLVRTGSLPSPAEFLTALGCPLSPPDGWAERVLADGRGLLLVDGLDEIQTADRHRTRDWLLALIHSYPGNRWLLTSRPTAVRPDWLSSEDFRELVLAPMQRLEVTTFVRRWHRAAQAREYEGQLLDALRSKRDLARIATNPLMCGLICALHRERRGYLPTGRKEVYDAALSMLLARRDRERGMAAVDGGELGEEAQLEILQRLAYAMVLSGRAEMSIGTAEGIVERCLPVLATTSGRLDASTLLRTLLLRSGLLRQPAEGVVDFVHRTFQDYLGARYAIEEGHLDVLVGHADDAQWEDVVRMAVGHARPRERGLLLRQLLARDIPRLTLLALACLEHAAALDPTVRLEVEERAAALIPPRTTREALALAGAGPLVLELLPGPEGLTALEARCVTVTASVLGTAEPVGAIGVLRRYRDHPALAVRRQLAGSWSRFDAGEYATEVLDHLTRDRLFVVCESAEQRAALRLMRPWRSVAFRGSLALHEMADAVVEPAAVNTLSLERNPALTSLEKLSAFPSLVGLWIVECPAVHGLEPLSELTVTDLAVFTPIADLTGLDGLHSLDHLSIGQRLNGAALPDALPTEARLEYLYLGHNSTSATGLRGLSQWPGLEALCLSSLSTALTAADWREIAEHPALTSLSLYGPLPFPEYLVPELPGIEDLRVPASYGDHVLQTLAARMPRLRKVLIRSDGMHLDPDDLARHAELFPGAQIKYDRG